jgi:glutamate/tyrosine decarboxylase-like PLP-dependent enzyme
MTTTARPITARDPLAQIHENPLTIARNREHVALIAEAARRSGSYLANAAHRSIAAPANAVAALDAFRRPLQDEPVDARAVLAELDALGSPATTIQGQGRYFGYVNGGLDPAAHAAAILAGTWDQNVGAHIMTPIATTLDEVAGEWVVDALGLPSSAQASFNAGATIANLTGIIAARDALYAKQGWDVGHDGLAGAPALRIIVGNEIHASALKALRLAGLGTGGLERIPTDSNGAIIADAFPTDTDDATLVLLQAGNVNTGHSDPFTRIIPGVRERGGWVHVDGAFGLWAAASPEHRHLVAGVEFADSWATDAHKWLNAPYDSGILIVRDPATAVRSMSTDAAYLNTGETAPPFQRGIQMSQRARGVETWAVLASHGKTGLADLIDRSIGHAQHFAHALTGAGAAILAPVVLNQVLVAFGDDATTNAVIAAVQAEGTLWAGGTVWHGKHAMRLSVSDAATTRDDIDASAAAIVRLWNGLKP